MSKTTKGSAIWHYFEPVDPKNTKCLLCQSIYRNSGNTTNLIDHLKRKHREEYLSVVEIMKQQSSSDSNSLSVPENNNENSTENLEDSNIDIKPQNTSTTTQEMIEQQASEESKTAIVENNEKDNVTLMEESQDIQIVKIVPLPHARSEVWNYFGFVANNEGHILDKSKVVCKICTSTFCYSGNTTNFYSHLKSMHSEIQIRAVPVKQLQSTKRSYSSLVNKGDINSSDIEMTNDTANGNINQYSSLQHDSTTYDTEDPLPDRSMDNLIYIDDITQCLVDFLVTDCRPLCVLQGRGFQRLLRLLAPGYVLPDKHKLSNALRKRYDELRKEQHDSNSTSIMDRIENLL